MAAANSPSEQQWIARARAGELEAFNQLVLLHQDMAFRLACWLLGDEAGAQDVVQNAFLAAYHAMREFRGGAFRGWLLRMVRNACIDELRRRKRHPWLALEAQDAEGEAVESAAWLVDPGAGPEELLVQRETWSRLEACLARLPEHMRSALVLVDVEALDYQEAAQALAIQLGTLKSRVGRARVQLRAMLAEEAAGPTFKSPEYTRLDIELI